MKYKEKKKTKNSKKIWEIECFYGIIYYQIRHGTRLTNIVSILNQGLRIAPKEAPI